MIVHRCKDEAGTESRCLDTLLRKLSRKWLFLIGPVYVRTEMRKGSFIATQSLLRFALLRSSIVSSSFTDLGH